MAGKLKMYNEKIAAYKKFYSIVGTIKKVALSKYRTLQVRVKTRDSTQRYTKKTFDLWPDWSEDQYLREWSGQVVYFPICTNRGNCGPTNSAQYKYLKPVIEEVESRAGIFNVGKKGLDSLPKIFPENHNKMAVINDLKQAKSFAWATFVLEHLDNEYPDAERVQIVFHRFVSAGVQRQTNYNIPSFTKWSEQMSEIANAAEPSEGMNSYRLANAIMDQDEEFVKDYYDFHRNIAYLNADNESELSEAAARIMAVEGQLTNIKEMLDITTLLYNKTRQACVTAALMEIISAKVALEDAEAGSGIEKSRFWETASA